MAAPATEYELALLVKDYLESKGFTKTASMFTREGKKILGFTGQRMPAREKTLPEILNEYYRLNSVESQRKVLQRSNPVIDSVFKVLDYHAAGLPPPPEAAHQLYFEPIAHQTALQLSPPAAARAQTAPTQQAAPTENPLPELVPASQCVQPKAAPEAENGPLHLTPGRHGQRKRAPKKRKRLDSAFDVNATRALQPEDLEALFEPPPSTMNSPLNSNHAADIWNHELDVESLEALLTDPPMQNKFAAGLADFVNRKVMTRRPEGTAAEEVLDGFDFSSSFGDLFDDEMCDLMSDVFMPNLQENAALKKDPSQTHIEGQNGFAGQPNNGGHAAKVSSPPKAADPGGRDANKVAVEVELYDYEIQEAVAELRENPEELYALIEECIA